MGKEHYIPEQNFLETKLIDINNFKDVDIIILDGGEYTTKGDFNILINRKPSDNQLLYIIIYVYYNIFC